MIRDKRFVAGSVVVLIALSFVLYVVLVRHSQASQERRARTLVQRWYDRNRPGGSHVVRCRLADLGGNVIDGFDCTVTGPCAGTHTFLVPKAGSLRPYRDEAAC